MVLAAGLANPEGCGERAGWDFFGQIASEKHTTGPYQGPDLGWDPRARSSAG